MVVLVFLYLLHSVQSEQHYYLEYIMTIHYEKSNIFASQKQVIVNPVNCRGVMGRGLALAFKRTLSRNVSRLSATVQKRNAAHW